MANNPLNLPANLPKGAISGNWKVVNVIDAATAQYELAETNANPAGAAYTGLQKVMESTTQLALTASLQTYTMPATLIEGDLLEVQHQFNGSAAERQSVWVRVQAGSTQRNFPWPDVTNNTHYWVFPATLDATFQVRQATASSSPRIMSVKVWRDAANGFVVPTGTTIATPYAITVNGGSNGTFTGHEGVGPETFYITMPVGQEIDVFPVVAGVNLRNRQAGMISVDRSVGAGALALTGITFRNLGVKSKYFGTADNQAGHTGDTNGGHTFTQRFMRGSGITTANNSTFTLSGGIYRIRYAVTHHKGPNCWSARALFVNGAEVTSIYTGSDGSNWESGGDLEWIVDATSANQTVQMVRTATNGASGNVDCWLAIEREEGYALPEGYQTREACALTSVNGNFFNGTTSLSIPTGTGEWISFQLGTNQQLNSCTGSAGLTVGTIDMKAGAAWVTVANGTTSGTLTVNIGAKSPAWLLTTANAGVAVTLGTLKFQLTASGNRQFQIASATGAAITAVVATTSQSNAGSSPGGTGINTLSLAANGAFQSTRNYNFGGQGDVEAFQIEDQTNARRYFIQCEIGAAFNGNSFAGFEL